jgi:uncharacterized protein YjaZ
MKKLIPFTALSLILITLFSAFELNAQSAQQDYIYKKNNGNIILAYKLFDDFLSSDLSWSGYRKILLESCPELLVAHNKALEWGSIDSVKFRTDITKYRRADWENFLSQYDKNKLDYLYDTLISRANKTLASIESKPLDLCLFLPYSGCFIIPGKDKNTIYISLLINPADVPKIMIHEYAHSLHIQRRPVESFTLRREIVSEGMAVYLTTLILNDQGVSRSIPFMPEDNVKWCFSNEQLIKSSIRSELNDTSYNCLRKFIADGSFSSPPPGFVEKTGYFAGYRIIKACIDKGLSLEQLCSLDSEEVLKLSGYFN